MEHSRYVLTVTCPLCLGGAGRNQGITLQSPNHIQSYLQSALPNDRLGLLKGVSVYYAVELKSCQIVLHENVMLRARNFRSRSSLVTSIFLAQQPQVFRLLPFPIPSSHHGQLHLNQQTPFEKLPRERSRVPLLLLGAEQTDLGGTGSR